VIDGDPDEEWGELELVIEGLGDPDPLEGTQYILKVHRDEDIASEAEERFGPGEGPHQKYNVETDVCADGAPIGGTSWKEGFDTADEAIAWIENPPAPTHRNASAALALPRGAVRLPDNKQWTNRFEIKSESSDRVYTVAQNKAKGHWGCSCPSWRTRRTCKHLKALGLPELEEPSPIAVLEPETAPMAQTEAQPAPEPKSPPPGALALPRGAVKLPDNKLWTNRFEIKSETSDRTYIVAQNKAKGHWGCSCPSWRTRRTCKHLEALGLPELEEPAPIAVLAARIAGRAAATMTDRGKVEGWHVELREDRHKRPCLTCGRLTYGRNEYGKPQDFTCYFAALVEAQPPESRPPPRV
jgi:hypothetical protein